MEDGTYFHHLNNKIWTLSDAIWNQPGMFVQCTRQNTSKPGYYRIAALIIVKQQ